MTDLAIYFKPVQGYAGPEFRNLPSKRLGEIVSIYSEEALFPSLESTDLAIIGIDEDRNAVMNTGCSFAADAIRPYLYQLFPGDYNLKITDLGNIRRGNTPEDTYFAVSTLISFLIRNKVTPIIIGGGQDLTYAAYQAYRDLGRIINLSVIDNRLDIGETDGPLNSRSYLSHIILHKPNYLFNYANIGYQSYLVDKGAIDLLKELFFDSCRLGIAQSNIQEMEPILRNADMVSFDISAIRQSDAPGNGNASPNGFYGEQACQLARYAGLSSKLSCMGFFEMNPTFDRNGQTAQLLAQMIWYFIDGYYHRQNEMPLDDPHGFIRYNVQLPNHNEGILFYKSKLTERWWMEVKCTDSQKERYHDHFIVPCSYSDYQIACTNEIPDRWWQAYQKLM